MRLQLKRVLRLKGIASRQILLNALRIGEAQLDAGLDIMAEAFAEMHRSAAAA